MARTKQTAKRNAEGLPIATINPGDVKKYTEQKRLYLSKLPPV